MGVNFVDKVREGLGGFSTFSTLLRMEQHPAPVAAGLNLLRQLCGHAALPRGLPGTEPDRSSAGYRHLPLLTWRRSEHQSCAATPPCPPHLRLAEGRGSLHRLRPLHIAYSGVAPFYGRIPRGGLLWRGVALQAAPRIFPTLCHYAHAVRSVTCSAVTL